MYKPGIYGEGFCVPVDKEHWELGSQPNDIQITNVFVPYSSVPLPTQGVRRKSLCGVMEGKCE